MTLFFAAGGGLPRVYPLGEYRNLNSAENQIRGADVPCGVRVTGWDAYNFTSTQYIVTGPTNVNSVPGDNAWSSMRIERIPGANCP